MVQFLARMMVPAKMENASVLLSTEELSVMEVSSCCCSIVLFVVFVIAIFIIYIKLFCAKRKTSQCSGRFPSCLSPLFQSESLCKGFHMEISFIHM